jgi:hypothetical protein
MPEAAPVSVQPFRRSPTPRATLVSIRGQGILRREVPVKGIQGQEQSLLPEDLRLGKKQILRDGEDRADPAQGDPA